MDAGHPPILVKRLFFYIPYGWRFFIQRRQPPLIYGIASTDRCNLHCRGCHVAHTDRPDMTWTQMVDCLKSAWRRGFRELYFSGGEPLLWRDGKRTIEDAIDVARRIGFFHVHLYTNGTLGLRSSADLVWVSMDGLPGTYELRRGDHFDDVVRSIRASRMPRIALIYVIDRHTASGIEPFLRWIRESRLPVLGVMFYFHTPYYGRDEMYLSSDERAPLIGQLQEHIRNGLPVLNSRAGLAALRSGNWPRRFAVSSVVDVDGESVCCRATENTCRDCGYAACTELTEFQRLRPSAVRAMLRYW